MPIVPPNVYYFDNNPSSHISYTKIFADYEKRKLSCTLNSSNSKIKIFQKKWVLKSFDKKREIETDSDKIDFSLAEKFPNMTCETILFDGLLYKKSELSEKFSTFENWPNTSPGIRSYTTSSITEFSISDYFKTKEVKQYYFCESGADQVTENLFCSLIDRDTGSIDNKNSDYNKILRLLGSEKYKILNLKIGIKQDNKVIEQTGLQFILHGDNIESDSVNLPPKIEFKNFIYNKYFVCKSGLFLYKPNNKNITWFQNEKKIPDITDNILPQKYIQFAQSYTCANNNGESEKFTLDKSYLEIKGLSQISFTNEDSVKTLKYEANLNLQEGNYHWTCQSSININCEVIGTGKNPLAEFKITPSTQFKKSLLHEKVKLILEIDDDKIEKEVVVFNYKEKENLTENLSKDIFISVDKNDNQFKCNIPEPIVESSMLNIYWYIGDNEIEQFRNKKEIHAIVSENNIACIVSGKILNKDIIGAAVYVAENPNKKNPSWLKEVYLFDLYKSKKTFLFSQLSGMYLNNISCHIVSENGLVLSTNICVKDKKNDVYININETELESIKNYILSTQIIDIFNIPYFDLKIKIFDEGKIRSLNTKIKFTIPNYRPVIHASGIYETGDKNQKCFVIASDPQNMLLSTIFYLDKNKISKNVSFFNYQEHMQKESAFSDLLKKLKEKNIYFYSVSFNYRQKEDYCTISVGNGTTLSQVRTPKLSERELKKILTFMLHDNKNKVTLFDKNNEKKFRLLKNKIVSKSIKPSISFHKVKNINSDSPFIVKYQYGKEDLNMDVFYSTNKVIENLFKFSHHKSPYDLSIPNLEEESGTFLGYFLASRLEAKVNNNKEFKCEASPKEYENVSQLFKYNVFLNENLLLERQTTSSEIFFEVKNLKDTDVLTCKVQKENKIESSSYSVIDKTAVSSFCYALDKNNSILTFTCPKEINFIQSKYEMQSLLSDSLKSQFKTLNFITYAHMALWSKSQKNKLSITFKLQENEK